MLCLLVEESKSIWTLRDEVTSYSGGTCSLWSRAHKGWSLHRRLSDIGLQGVHARDFQDACVDNHSAEMVWKGWANAYCRQHVHDLKEGESQSEEGEGLSLWSFGPVSRTEKWQGRLFKPSGSPRDFELSGWIICHELKIAKPIISPDLATILTNYLTICNWLYLVENLKKTFMVYIFVNPKVTFFHLLKGCENTNVCL